MSTEPTVTLPLPLEYQEAVVQKLSPFELITNTLFCDELDGAIYRTNLGKRPQLRVTLRTLETTGMITVDVLDSFGAVEGTWNIVPKFIEYAPDMYHNCLFKMNEITVVSNVPETEIDTNRSAVFTVHLIRLARQLYKNVDFSIIFNETNSIPEEEPGFHWGRMEEAREIRFIKTKLRPKEYMTLQKYLMPQHILYLDDENFPVVKCLTVQTIVIKKCPDFTVRKFRLFSCRHLIVNYRVMDGRTINRYLMQWIGGTHPELKVFKVPFAKKSRVLQGLKAKKADASPLSYNFGGQIHDLSKGYEIENCFGKRGTIKFQNRGLIFVVEPTQTD